MYYCPTMDIKTIGRTASGCRPVNCQPVSSSSFPKVVASRLLPILGRFESLGPPALSTFPTPHSAPERSAHLAQKQHSFGLSDSPSRLFAIGDWLSCPAAIQPNPSLSKPIKPNPTQAKPVVLHPSPSNLIQANQGNSSWIKPNQGKSRSSKHNFPLQGRLTPLTTEVGRQNSVLCKTPFSGFSVFFVVNTVTSGKPNLIQPNQGGSNPIKVNQGELNFIQPDPTQSNRTGSPARTCCAIPGGPSRTTIWSCATISIAGNQA